MYSTKKQTIIMHRFQLTLVSVSLILLASCERSPAELRFVAPLTPVDREIAQDLATLLGRESAVTVKLTANPESEEAALDALAAGNADIALVSNNMPFRDGISTVMPLYPTVLHIGYQGDRDNSSGYALLLGAKVFAGPAGSASRMMFERIVARMKLTADDFSYVDDLNDKPDVVIVFAPISPTRFAKFPGYRLFSLGSPKDIGQGSLVDAAVLLNPQLRPFVIPVSTYGDATPEPVLTIAVDKMLVARHDLDESVVYDLVGELLRLRPAIAALRPGLLQHMSDDFDISRSTFVLHPGAQAYLQRSAPTIYERYANIAEVGITLLIAIFSAAVAGVRVLRIRRKNRIDVFYSKTIALRKSAQQANGPDERRKIIEEIRSLQNDAFELLVDEKLAADESFRIFITLSNDVQQQLGAISTDRELTEN